MCVDFFHFNIIQLFPKVNKLHFFLRTRASDFSEIKNT